MGHQATPAAKTPYQYLLGKVSTRGGEGDYASPTRINIY